MKAMRAWIAKLAAVVSRSRDAELNDELEAHLQHEIEDRIRAGEAPDMARRQALLHAGGLEAAKEAYRDQHTFAWVAAARADAAYAARFLRHNPGFTLAAVLSLGLGIGINVAIFSIVDTVLLRPLPVVSPDRLVQVYSSGTRANWTYPLWEQLKARPGIFDGAAAFSAEEFDLAEHGRADIVSGLWTNARFFDVFGVRAILGRTFSAASDMRGGGPDGAVAVISERFWRNRFHGDPAVIGRSLLLNKVRFTIIGVTPRAFFGPQLGESFDVAVPYGAEPLVKGAQSLLDQGGSGWGWIRVIARLRPGQSLEAASAELAAVHAAIREATLPTAGRPADIAAYLNAPMTLVPAPDGVRSSVRSEYRDPLLIAMVVVALVLMIACINIASLLLARAEARAHELSVRLALGASRGRLVRQLLTESLLISALGAVLAVACAHWGAQLLIGQLSTFRNSFSVDVPTDWRVLLFAAATALLVAFLFGTLPALHATRVQASDVLRDRSRGAAGRRGLVGRIFVPVQMAVSLALVFVAVLFGRSFSALSARPLGFDAKRVLVAELTAPPAAGRGNAAVVQDFWRARDAVAALPGVSAVGLSVVTPLSNSQWAISIENPDGVSVPQEDRDLWLNHVSPQYFPAMGTPITRGRNFTVEDQRSAETSIIVNEAFARKFFPGREPLGQVVRRRSRATPERPPMTVVGVVADAVYSSLREDVPPTIYSPFADPASADAITEASLTVRTDTTGHRGLDASIAAAFEKAVPGLTFRLRPLAEHVSAAMVSERTVALMAGFFGALSLLLAGIGLYGVVSYTVGRRRAEIGVRLALGARPSSIVGLVALRVAALLGVGIAAGAPLGMWASTFARSVLFGLGSGDLWTLAVAAAALLLVGVVASGLPAWRAAHIDVLSTLRKG